MFNPHLRRLRFRRMRRLRRLRYLCRLNRFSRLHRSRCLRCSRCLCGRFPLRRLYQLGRLHSHGLRLMRHLRR